MNEIDNDEIIEYGEIVEEITLSNGSWVSVYEYKDLYYYIDEVETYGPFEDYEKIEKLLDQVRTHVQNDSENKIIYEKERSITNVNFFNSSRNNKKK